MIAPNQSSGTNSATVAGKAKLIHRACTALLAAGSRPTFQKVADHDQDLSIATVSRSYHRRITQAAQARFDRAGDIDEPDEFTRIGELIADGSWVSWIFEEIGEHRSRGRSNRNGYTCGQAHVDRLTERTDAALARARERIRRLTAKVTRLEAELSGCREEIAILSAAPLPFRPFFDPNERA